MAEHACDLCAEFGRSTPADVHATIPMAGEHPRYWLCLPCWSEVGEYADEVDLPVEVPRG